MSSPASSAGAHRRHVFYTQRICTKAHQRLFTWTGMPSHFNDFTHTHRQGLLAAIFDLTEKFVCDSTFWHRM